jgi:hypothetical protein
MNAGKETPRLKRLTGIKPAGKIIGGNAYGILKLAARGRLEVVEVDGKLKVTVESLERLQKELAAA